MRCGCGSTVERIEARHRGGGTVSGGDIRFLAHNAAVRTKQEVARSNRCAVRIKEHPTWSIRTEQLAQIARIEWARKRSCRIRWGTDRARCGRCSNAERRGS